MKKYLFLMLAACLAFMSCQKDDSTVDEEASQETFVWEGETFEVADTRTKLSLILAVDEEQFVFVPDSMAFQWKRPTSQNIFFLYLKDYMPTIKNLDK